MNDREYRPGWMQERRRSALPHPGGPMLNLPPVLTWLIGINIAVHLVRFLLPGRADDLVLLNLGFTPAVFSYGGPIPLLTLISPLTYMFLHGGMAHLLINMATLAAFGTPLERAFGGWRTVVYYVVSGLVAALIHFLVYPASEFPLVGASGAISGLFGGTLMLMRHFNRRAGDRRTNAALIAVWVSITLLFAFFDIGIGGDNVAWIAHLGGFVAGIALYPVLRPRLRFEAE
jgi:membrane associated rhomboid family serine protease